MTALIVLTVLVMWFALGCIIASPLGRFLASANVIAK